MQSQNSLDLSNGIFFKLKSSFKKLYKNSNFYEKRISKTFDNNFEYKPSPHLLSSIIKYQKKKYKIEDFATEAIWQNNISSKDFKTKKIDKTKDNKIKIIKKNLNLTFRPYMA